MKHFIITLLLLSPTAHARTWEQIHSTKTLKVATEGSFVPFNFYQGKTLTGFEIDYMEAVAKKLGLKVEWQAVAFDSLLIGLNQDRYDVVIASHAVTPERTRAVKFLTPHYCSGAMIFSKKGGPKTPAELKGKTVAVQVGTTYLQIAQKIPGIKEAKVYPKDSDALQSLLSDKVDAWITDRFGGMEIMKKTGADRLQTGELLNQEQIAAAVTLSNEYLQRELNIATLDLLKSGTYTAISKKYFGSDIRCH